MTRTATNPLAGYCFVGDFDRGELTTLHELVVEFRGAFLENHALQDVLLNKGYDLGRERPKTFHDYHSRVHHRIVVSVNLLCLEHMIDLATRPISVQIESPLILTPGADDGPTITTFEGHDPVQIERIQKEWFRKTGVVEDIRKYQRILQLAFDEFNLQYILGLMHQARMINLPIDAGEEVDLQQRIRDAITNHPARTYPPLDNAYYIKASREMGNLNPLWQRLNDDEFGRLFILQREEIERGVAGIMSPENIRLIGPEPE